MPSPLPAAATAASPSLWTPEIGIQISLGMLILGIIGTIFVYIQLKKLAEANQNSNLMLVVQVEVNIATARHKIVEASSKLYDASQAQPLNQNDVDNATHLRRSAVVEYLNAFDRLCAFIRRGNIDEEIYREDYRQTIVDDVKAYPDMFKADTRHRNVLKVHDAWYDGKAANEKKKGLFQRLF